MVLYEVADPTKSAFAKDPATAVIKLAFARIRLIATCRLSRQCVLEAWKKDIEAVIVRSCGGQTEDLCECGREVKEKKIGVLKGTTYRV